MKKRCIAETTSGQQCGCAATAGNYCGSHSRNPNPKGYPFPKEFIEEEITVMPEEKKIIKQSASTTKPWNSNENPWSKNKFSLENRHEGFHARFTSNSKMTTRLQEGWVKADGKNYGEQAGSINRVGMTLMELPNEMLALRKEHFDNLTKQRSVSARDVQIAQGLKEKVRLIGE